MTDLEKEIILSLAENDMSILKTAGQLNYHRNTITYHIEKVKAETKLNARNFYDLIKLVEMAKE